MDRLTNRTPEEIARLTDDGPCPECGDSGYAETYHGGIWTGESVRSSYAICDCIYGDDVRRERTGLAVRSHLESGKP